MSKNTFTAAQTATFDNFRSEVEQYMLDNSEGNKSFRLMDVPTFLSVFKVASQPTKLRPVGNFTSSLKERGRTKLNSVKRTPNGDIRYHANGDAMRTFNRVVMYLKDSYRERRASITGLKKTETVFAIRWEDVPAYIQQAVSRVFPLAKPEYPTFVPKNLCMVLRHGLKAEGKRRHAWGGFDFCISGLYGEDAVVVPQVAVKRKITQEGSTTENIAKACGATCPDWGQNEATPVAVAQEEAPITVSSALSEIAEDCGF